jgi:DNA-binding protein Fis
MLPTARHGPCSPGADASEHRDRTTSSSDAVMTTNGTDDAATRSELVQLARVVARAVPMVVDQLASAHPRRVYREAMALMERPLLAHALSLTGGNQLRAARLLGVNRNTLRKRCRDLGLAPVRPTARGPAASNP